MKPVQNRQALMSVAGSGRRHEPCYSGMQALCRYYSNRQPTVAAILVAKSIRLIQTLPTLNMVLVEETVSGNGEDS